MSMMLAFAGAAGAPVRSQLQPRSVAVGGRQAVAARAFAGRPLYVRGGAAAAAVRRVARSGRSCGGVLQMAADDEAAAASVEAAAEAAPAAAAGNGEAEAAGGSAARQLLGMKGASAETNIWKIDPPAADEACHVGASGVGRHLRRRRVGQLSLV